MDAGTHDPAQPCTAAGTSVTALLPLLPCAACQLDATGHVLGCNAAFRACFANVGIVEGQSFEQLLTAWLGPVSAPGGLAQWRLWWSWPGPSDAEIETSEPPEQAASATLHLEGADGRHLALLPGASGLLLINDVSRFRQRERALQMTARDLEASVQEQTLALDLARQSAERAQRSKSRFFAAASHDLLQPLNAARIYASALADIPGLEPVAVDVSQRIDIALRDAEDIVDSLVDVARFDSSGVQAQVETLDLERLLEPLLDQYGSLARHRALTLRWHAGSFRVRSDPRLLRRVLQNLIGNALRYTARGGVLIGVRRRGASVRIEVWDTGPGIPPAQQALVFEEFRRLEQQSPWGERGLGLGLWICRRIAALLDHRLDLRSRPGRGSVFAVEVPLAEADSAPTPLPPGRAVGPLEGCSHRPLALVLEANADVRAALETLLAGWGMAVLAEADPVRAITALAGRQPLLALMDDEVPGALALLEAWPACAPQPQWVLFANERSKGLVRRAHEAGVMVLGKPLKPARLRAIVEDAVRNAMRS